MPAAHSQVNRMANAPGVNSEDFIPNVLQSQLPVLVDFWAEWCGPCKALGPAIDQFAAEYAGRLRVVKCDVDSNSELATEYGIMSIPAVLLFKDGKEVDRVVGNLPQQIKWMIENHV